MDGGPPHPRRADARRGLHRLLQPRRTFGVHRRNLRDRRDSAGGPARAAGHRGRPGPVRGRPDESHRMNPTRTLAGEIRARCAALGDSPVVHFVSKALGDRTVSWATLLESAETVARDIRSAPLQSGVVVIVLDHSLELLDSLIGSILADRTPTIFSLPSFKLNMPKYFEALPKLLANAQPDLIITSPELYRQLSTWGISL